MQCSDDEIGTSDIAPLSDEFFSKAKLQIPSSSLDTVLVRIESETLSWFQSKGEEAEKYMAAALRIYAEAQKIRLVCVNQHNNSNAADS